MSDSKKTLLPLAAATLFIVLFGNFMSSFFKNSQIAEMFGISASGDRKAVVIGKTKVFVDIADTPNERQKGLSGRKSLGKNEGMLFVFESKDTQPAFWMQGMFIPIDIIWINDGVISQLDVNIPQPKKDTLSSDLPLYKALVPVDYVLEVNAGFVKNRGLAIGDSVDLSGAIAEP